MSDKLFNVEETMKKFATKSRMSLQLKEEKANINVKKGTRDGTKIQINLYSQKDIDAMLKFKDTRNHPSKGGE